MEGLSKMKTTDIPDFAEARSPDNDSLSELRAHVAALRDLEFEKVRVEESLSNINRQIYSITRETLPDLFTAKGVTSVGLPATGNTPGYTATLDTEIKAGIARDWSADRREKAFEYLNAQGASDLIKATVTVDFDKAQLDRAVKLRRYLVDQGFAATLDMTVHHMTLTSWLRERWRRGTLPAALDTIGGYVGAIVKLKQEKK